MEAGWKQKKDEVKGDSARFLSKSHKSLQWNNAGSQQNGCNTRKMVRANQGQGALLKSIQNDIATKLHPLITQSGILLQIAQNISQN